MRLDIVIPIWNEQELLPLLCQRIATTCDSIGDCDWRVIFVNDGSRDESLAMMLRHRETNPRFTVIELARNFGHQPALSAGLQHTNGDAAVMMDGDLQDPPEVIVELVKSWRDGGEVVRAVRRTRAERGLRRVGFAAFHMAFRWISDYPIPANTGIFGLLDRRAVEALNALPESNRFIPGLREWIGFEQRTVYYDRQERVGGEPKQTFARLVRYAIDGVFSFSYKPLRLMTWFGVATSVTGFAVAVAFAIRRLSGHEIAMTGFTTLITVTLFLGGVQLIAVGLLGEYLGRVYDEVKRRPLYIVRSRHGITSPAPAR